jgi:predicted amidohydrolase
MGNVCVSLLQVNSGDQESPAVRYQRVINNLVEAAKTTKKPDLIILPELWHGGAFNIDRAVSLATIFPGPISDDICDIASTYGVWIHAGSFIEKQNSTLFNTSLIVNSQGQIAATYKKIHLFGFQEGESKYLTHGDELVCIATPLGMTALTTCYDLRFPELFRELNDKGATSVLMISGWPAERISHWNTLTKARAIENQVYFMGCNGVGENGDTKLGGNSLVVDPWGEVLNIKSEVEEVITVEFDLQYVNKVREKLPVLADRRIY